jgi:hypothetical protein
MGGRGREGRGGAGGGRGMTGRRKEWIVNGKKKKKRKIKNSLTSGSRLMCMFWVTSFG